MKNKLKNRFLSVLVCICILLPLLASCSALQSRYEPALWQITGPNGETMYIMGSIHIGDESMYPFDDRINSALESCDYLAVEYDIVSADERAEQWTDMESFMYLSQYMYTGGDNIKNHLSAQTYNAAKAYLTQKSFYTAEMDYFVPAFWDNIITSLIIEDTGFNSDIGVDRVLIKLAREVGKEVLEIETEAMQTELVLSFDDIVYDDSISGMIESKDDIKTQYAYMIDLWKRGRDDLVDVMSNGLSFLYSGPEDGEYAAAYEDYNKRMIADRNVSMAEVAHGYMKEGKKVFFVVGVGHIRGDNGIIKLLEEKGYTANKV